MSNDVTGSMLDSGSNRLGSNPGWTTAMKIKIYLILFFLNYYSFSKEEDYNKLVLNTSNDNFSESVKIFEDVEIKKRDAKYWYFYGCLYHNALLYNILSDDINIYFSKTLESYNNSLTFKNKEYNTYTSQNLVALYNTFMKRGIEYLKLNSFKYALEAFDYSKQIFEQELTPKVKKTFIKNIENNFNEVLAFSDLLEYPNKTNEIQYYFLDTYFKMNNFEKTLLLIEEMLLDDPYDIFALRFLYETKKIKKELNVQEYLSSNLLENEIQKAALLFFSRDFEKAYQTLKNIKYNKKNIYLYCDILYNYCIYLQQQQNSSFKKHAKECITICKKIFYDNYKNKKILKRLYYLYMSINDTKSADKIVKFHKIS